MPTPPDNALRAATRAAQPTSLRVRAEHELTADERAACDALWWRAFAVAGEAHRSPPPPREARLLLFDDGGALLAAASLTPCLVTIAGECVRVAGLGGVAVPEERRGRGYGSRVVAAFARHAAAGYAWAALSCEPRRRAFYERLGWRVLAGPLTVREAERERPPLGFMMAPPLTPDAAADLPTWLSAPITLGPGEW